MNLRDLEYLEAVAINKNFSRAALACNVSQPALSSQIKKLEQELGVEIFDRRNNEVLLTEFGARIIDKASLVNRNTRAIKDVAMQFKDQEAFPFKLGITPTLAPYLIGYFRDLIGNLYPTMRVVLVEDKPVQLARKIETREIDVAFLARKTFDKLNEKQEKPSLSFQSLWLEPLFLAVKSGTPLASRKSILAKEVPADRLIRFSIPFGYELEKDLPVLTDETDSKTEFDVTAARFETVCRHISHSEDCTIVNSIAAEQFTKDRWGLSFIPFEDVGNKRDLGVVSRKGYNRQSLLDNFTTAILGSPPAGTYAVPSI